MNLVCATVGFSLAMTGAGVMTRGAEEAGAGPGTAGTGLNPGGRTRLLAELGAWLDMEWRDIRILGDVKKFCLILHLSVTEMPDGTALDKTVVSGFPETSSMKNPNLTSSETE